MSEREPRTIARTGEWTVARLAARIGHAPQRTSSPRNGDGLLYAVPAPAEHLPRTIAFFERERIVTVDAANLHVEVYNATAPKPAKQGILVEDERQTTRLLFLRDGHIAVEVMPVETPEPLESPTGIPQPQNGENIISPGNTAPGDAGDEIQALQEPVAPPESERQKRVKWQGYVSTDPRFTPGRDGLRANFVVSEKIEVDGEEKTVYHRVYTTKKEAERLQDKQLAKGQPVRVDGYVQWRDVQKPDGTTAREPRVYANHVTVLARQKDQHDGGESEPGANAAGSRRGDA